MIQYSYYRTGKGVAADDADQQCGGGIKTLYSDRELNKRNIV